MTQFSPPFISRPLSSKWSAAPGRGESTPPHTAFNTHKPFNTYSDAQTTHTKHQNKFQLLQNHFPSFSLTTSCVHPRTFTFCFLCTHVRVLMRMCVWLYMFSIRYGYCVCSLYLHVFCYVFYISRHLPSLFQHAPAVPSVPATTKAGVSSVSLQRSRSDVDVNAAAVAKHRHVGQARGTGRLPPGSYSSLGKGHIKQVR